MLLLNILHYGLGFPPYRSGGMTKFCIDLMEQQKKEGHQVSLLWPGKMNLIRNKTIIKDRGHVNGIRSFEIVNPLPIPYDEGISDIESFIRNVPESVYEPFLKKVSPNIIHLHTLMGIHKAFLLSAKKMDIKLVFTAHDFFPICPKVTMYRNGHICSNIIDCKKCGSCNSTALSIEKIKLLQSSIYRMTKNTLIVKKLRKKHRSSFLSDKKVTKKVNSSEKTSRDYLELRNSYKSMLEIVDCIHCNSSITESIYQKILQLKNLKVISITHGSIEDNRRIKQFDGHIRFAYLGPAGGAKGFFC